MNRVFPFILDQKLLTKVISMGEFWQLNKFSNIILLFKICLIICGLFVISCEKDIAPLQVDERGEIASFWEFWENSPGDRINAITQNSHNDFISSADIGIKRSTDGGQTWEQISDEFAMTLETDPVNDAIFGGFTAGLTGWLEYSVDNGKTWLQPDSGIDSDVQRFLFLPSGTILVGGTTHDESPGGIYRSTDHGKTWTSSPLGFMIGVPALVKTSQNTIFATILHYLDHSINGIYRSSNDGKTWKKLSTTFENAFPYRLVISSKDELNLLTTTGDFYLSKNQGETWQFVTNIERAEDMIIDPFDNMIISFYDQEKQSFNILLVKIDNGVFTSSVLEGLPKMSYDIKSMYIDRQGFVYIGTLDKGAFKSKMPLNTLTP